MNRECSAVGNTHRALWSWLIRRRRWSHALSSRSCSAAASPDTGLVSSTYPWMGSLIRLTEANGWSGIDPMLAAVASGGALERARDLVAQLLR